MNVILTLLYYTVKMSTPLLFVIMGGVFVQRAGVFNFALESAINTGAFAAIAVIMVTNNLLAGIIGALLACVLVNMFFALFTVKFNAHPTVVGTECDAGRRSGKCANRCSHPPENSDPRRHFQQTVSADLSFIPRGRSADTDLL